METYQYFKKYIHDNISKLNSYQKFKLGIELTEILYPDYVNFSTINSYGDSKIIDNIIKLSKVFLSECNIDKNKIEDLKISLNSITPDTDDFSEIEASYALNACVACGELLNFINKQNNQSIENIVTSYLDTVDFKIYEEDNSIEDEDICQHPKMIATITTIKEKICQSD